MIVRFLALLALLLAAGAAHAGEATPLFASNTPLEIRIEGPVRDLVRASDRSTDPYPATLIYDGKTWPIELSARGNSRRRPDVCQFPPLRVEFTGKPEETTLFHKQKKLKLVTHCRKSASYQQYVHLEYAAYKLFNVVTEASFRVRPLRVVYFDTERGREVATRDAFFIEDVDDLARRVDMKEIKRPTATLAQHDATALARASVFNFMIGNLDWSALDGPGDDDCCHNGKLIGPEKDAASGLFIVPYDFDFSGLVDAPYATPPDDLRMRDVRSRRYRGFCAHNAETLAVAAEIRAARADLESAIASFPGVGERTTDKAVKYLASFFDDIETDADVEKNLLKFCRD